MRFWTPPQPPFCHGNRQSVRYHTEGFGGDFYTLGPLGGVYASHDFGAAVGRVCEDCGFVFEMKQRALGTFTLKQCKVFGIPRELTVKLHEEYREEQHQEQLEWMRKHPDGPKLYTFRTHSSR